MQFSTAVRAARANATESTIGTSPICVILTGTKPANCAAAETGTRLAVMTLPSDWLTNPGDGTKALIGTWEDSSADAAGVGGYFRIYDSGGTVCGIQGTVTQTGGGGDMTLDNTNIAAAQDVKVTGFTLTEGNA